MTKTRWATKNTQSGFVITGNKNSLKQNLADKNQGEAFIITGNSNKLTADTASSSSSEGFVIVGNENKLSKCIASDNFGNGFTWGRPGTHDTSVKGIGILTGRSVDTQFALAPGQSRSATFNIVRFNAKPPIGNAWSYDVVIDEVEVLPGQVVRGPGWVGHKNQSGAVS